MLRVWNVTLVITTFFLTIFGTFMTRSGVVQSVHAFGDDPELARMFTIFMVTIVVVSFGFVIYRLPLLRARNELDSWVSREAAFLVNNWILLFCAVLRAVRHDVPDAQRGRHGPAHHGRPAVLQPLDGAHRAHPAVPDGHRAAAGVAQVHADEPAAAVRVARPVTLIVTGGLVTALGVRMWSSGICFALCGYVLGTIGQEFWRGAGVRQRGHRHGHLHGARRPRGPQQAALRRLHRPRRASC